jgi:hypothetical protein
MKYLGKIPPERIMVARKKEINIKIYLPKISCGILAGPKYLRFMSLAEFWYWWCRKFRYGSAVTIAIFFFFRSRHSTQFHDI